MSEGFKKKLKEVYKKRLKIRCDDANADHAYGFKTSLGKESWYRNHFSLRPA